MSTALDTRLVGTPGSRLVAFIAAHNGEGTIGATLASLEAQARPPDEVIVIADRCTDRTAEIAVSHGARVFHTVGDEFPSALKPRLQVALVDLRPSDEVLPVDAYGD